MKSLGLTTKHLIFTTMLLTGSIACFASEPDSLPPHRRFTHSLGVEFRPEYIFPSNPFLQGLNLMQKPMQRSLSAHLRYALLPSEGSHTDRIYRGVYQGIGAAYYNFGNAEQLGNPVAIYLFQGARIARISPHVSLNYEWNFGISYGWKPYDEQNQQNIMMGSKLNAYLNVDFYFLWRLTREIDLTAGVALTHFSNGNTKFPNAGLNTGGLKLGVNYNFGRTEPLSASPRQMFSEPFRRHMSYDVVLFGSWRRKGVAFGDKQIAAPEAYPVAGISFAAMYNFGYRFRAGVGLDGVYDSSANVYTEDVICSSGGGCPDLTFFQPDAKYQIALGVSARAEFVMPYFTVGIGLGFNALHRGGDLKQIYQMLTLKVAVTRSSFVHIGYNLKDFHQPNYLMLGLGYRFNNKYPRIR